MKSYTDIEQSKKLVELGIDVNTADMWYPPSLIEYGVVNKWWKNPTIIEDIEHSKLKKEYHVPCWSLAGLLNILPHPGCFQETSSHWFCDCFAKDGCYYEAEASNPVDACVEMVLRLHEQNIL